MEDFRTYYEVLDVPESATAEEVHASYRKLVKEFHPDRLVGIPDHLTEVKKLAEEKFREIQEAWATLGDPVKRSLYDEQLGALRGQSNSRSSPPQPSRSSYAPPPPSKPSPYSSTRPAGVPSSRTTQASASQTPPSGSSSVGVSGDPRKTAFLVVSLVVGAVIVLAMLFLAAPFNRLPHTDTPSAANKTNSAPEQGRPTQPLTPADTNGLSDASRVSPDGIGPVLIGMTVREASVASGQDLVRKSNDQAVESPRCYHVWPEHGPKGLSFMVLNEHVARVEVSNELITTVSGAHVNESEAEILSMYQGVEVRQNRHNPVWHNLIVFPNSLRQLNFLTDGSRVVTLMAGQMPAVQFVEGCL
jgi:curved DNA-binding protein CbpA